MGFAFRAIALISLSLTLSFVAHAETDATRQLPELFISASSQAVYPAASPEDYGSYYDWGRGQDGYGYCYQWTSQGSVLNGGSPVANYLCESTRPSYYDWGRGHDGWGYCYQWTPYGVAMNAGTAQANFLCEQSRPSHYSWGQGHDGNTYCYQYSPKGLALNGGQPVANYLCGG